MSYVPLGTLGVLRLLARHAVLRLLRASQVYKQKRRRAAEGNQIEGTERRRPTRRKRGDGLAWLMVLMLPMFLFQALLMTGPGVARLRAAATQYIEQPTSGGTEELQWNSAVSSPPEHDGPRYGGRSTGRYPSDNSLLVVYRPWKDAQSQALFAAAGALLTLLLLGGMLAIGFGGAHANLAGGEWTQAWLLTFPVTTRALVLARALEYALVQLFPWLTIAPLTYQLLRAQGAPWPLPLALLGTFSATFFVGGVRLWLETRLRLRCSLRTLRNIQGACTLLAMLMLVMAFLVLGPTIPEWFLDLAAAMPRLVGWLPASWPLGMSGAAAVLGIGLTALVFGLTVGSTTRLLAHGAMRSGGVDSGSRGRTGAWLRARRLGIVGKDLALLLRDRTFLVQTVLMPVFMIGVQLLVNPSLGGGRDGDSDFGSSDAMFAYGIGLLSLIGGCFQVLPAEGRALWMLYSLPVRIEVALAHKTRIWAALAVLYGWIALLAFALRSERTDYATLGVEALFVGAGLWCAAHIAAGVSVIGCNPNVDHVPRQPKARHIYLFFFLASVFFVGLVSPDFAPRVAALLVFATLAYSIWQRACDRLPSLLDPIDEPRRAVSLLDGGAALLVFFLAQALLGLLLAAANRDPMTSLLLAFVLAGAITVAQCLLVLSLRGVPVAQVLALRPGGGRAGLRAAALAVAAGVAVGCLGLGYRTLAQHQGWFGAQELAPVSSLELVLLAVLAAPLVEEILFRGLVFGGLVRSVPTWLAVVWSAGVFAVVHPSPSWLPVFAMGCVAAIVLHRTRWLPAAMLVHAVYNLIVVCC